jgi:oxaloacetate decarboxylase (Na+ extruding) subunit alpha
MTAVADRISIVDTTIRDGQMSLWATRMTTGQILPIAEPLDRAGFDAIEVIGSSFFKKCVRDLREDPWERIRLLRERMDTPLRCIKTRHIAAFQQTPAAVSRLWLERLSANGVSQVRVSDPSNTVANLQDQVRAAREAGMDAVVNLIFSISPKHTDEYYAERAAALADVPAMRLCLKDPGGLLTPDRVPHLVEVLTQSAGGRPLEIHSHCNTGLGPLCAVEAVKHGVRIVNTAIPPLSDAASLPSVFTFMHNMRVLGYEVDLDEGLLHEIERHLRAIAAREDLPIGRPAEWDAFHYRHQVPGGMISNFRHQLAQMGMEDKVDAVLEETSAVRADLGYPIMVTPYSQFVGSQAALNVIAGERYREVTDEVIAYTLGQWGDEEAGGVDPDVKDRILGRGRAREIAARQLDVGPSVSDDEFLLRFITSAADVEAMRRAGPVVEDRPADGAVVALVRALADSRRYGALAVESEGVKVTMLRTQGEEA